MSRTDGTGAITTVIGRRIKPLALTSADMDVPTIACGLGKECRWSSQLRDFHSVAHHSVLVSDYARELHCADRGVAFDAGRIHDAAERLFGLWGLVHDVPEGLGLRDTATPVKDYYREHFGSRYDAIEAAAMRAVCDWLELPHAMPALVEVADQAVLLAESRDLRPGVSMNHNPTVAAMPHAVVPIDCHAAEALWVLRFNLLTGQDHRPLGPLVGARS